MLFAQVAVLAQPYSVLTYRTPAYLGDRDWQVGQRVIVPLGRGIRAGVITDLQPEARQDLRDGLKVKAMVWPLEHRPILTPLYMEFIRHLGSRLSLGSGKILSSMLPSGLRNTQVRIRFMIGGSPKNIPAKLLAALSEEELRELADLWHRGMASVAEAGKHSLDADICMLTCDPPWPVRPAARAQAALLEHLFECGPCTRRQIRDRFGERSLAVLSVLARRNLIRFHPADQFGTGGQSVGPAAKAGFSEILETAGQVPVNEPPGPSTSLLAGDPAIPPIPIAPGINFQLTEQQSKVFETLRTSALSGRAESHLLFGVTGSGKTAIYLELARAVLQAGRSVLLLAPEVALAVKLWNDASATLPDFQPVLFHGYLPPSARERIFRDAARPEARLVVGTRSALFLPLADIGLIILDEEHDSSFKQDEGFIYQSKEVAWFRAGQHQALLLMGSATPDIKSFHAARQGRLPMHVLPERVGGSSLPSVRLITMPRSMDSTGLLVPESVEALNEVVKRDEQAVILLNRRGYAPLMYCLSCAAVAKCPHCDIGLSYHKGRERLLCHYCGHAVPFPSPCAVCKASQYRPMGEGTEKLEEHLGAILPFGTKVLRLDRDSTRRPGRMESILASFARREASVLVGTQMLSKGHHFPDVTLAIVAEADMGLNMPDYRAAERTFQLLVQSSGRSGRGNRPGQVLIQTRDPGHYCWQYVMNADYEGFYERELALREKRRYPPFVRLALLRISYPLEKGAEDRAVAEANRQISELGSFLRAYARERDIQCLGPAPAPLHFLKGRRRFHCLLKGQDWPSIRSVYTAAVSAARASRLRLTLDLDPVNML